MTARRTSSAAIPVDHGLRRLEFGEARGLPHHLGVEAQLVAEVIVDCGDIGPGGSADLADGGCAIAAVGEDAPGHVQQFVARGSESDDLRLRLTVFDLVCELLIFKQKYKTTV